MKLLFLLLFVSSCANSAAIQNRYYVDVVGNGVIDDTVSFQKSLVYCSINKLPCVIPANKKVRITGPVYIYNDSSLIGEANSEIIIDMADLTERFVFNIGIAARHKPRPPFTGTISDITFRAITGPTDKWQPPNRTAIAGRILQFWRAKHATIKDNIFILNEFFYGATGSQNNQYWLRGNEIKRNLTITNNQIYQDANWHGQECIGIGPAQDILISNNQCVGAGDDMIGAHYVDGLTVVYNTLFGVDGRIFISDSTQVKVIGNHVERMASTLDGQWYKGDTLIYLGYEGGARDHTRPGPATIANNILVYPRQSFDGGSAITVRGASDVIIKSNVIKNDSNPSTLKGIWIAPWRDGLTPGFEYDKYYVENISIVGNSMRGDYPLTINQTDSCIGYKGFVDIVNNQAKVGNTSCPAVVNKYGNQ